MVSLVYSPSNQIQIGNLLLIDVNSFKTTMAFRNFCRCCCGTREDPSDEEAHSPDDAQQSENPEHDPNQCPLVVHSESSGSSMNSFMQAQSIVANQSRRIRQGHVERDPGLSDEEASTRGKQVIQWMEDPNANDSPCPVTMNTLTYEQMQQESSMMHRAQTLLPVDDLSTMNFPRGVEGPGDYIRHVVHFGRHDKHTLFIGQNVICLYDISRKPNSTHSHVTDVALTLYKQEFESLETLRHVFALTVINGQTLQFITKDFELRSNDHFGTPDMLQSYTYEYGSPEYEIFLGTRIPRTVAYLVLGAFPRGSRRIARIEVYASPMFGYDIRFDIEPIS